MKRVHGADVHEEIEPPAHPEQDLVRVPPVRNARVAERARKNGVEVTGEARRSPRGIVSPV